MHCILAPLSHTLLPRSMLYPIYCVIKWLIMWGCDLLLAAVIRRKVVKKNISMLAISLCIGKVVVFSCSVWTHLVFSPAEELSISISVSNCQIQENVVSRASFIFFFDGLLHNFRAQPACICIHSCAIKVAIVVRSEIVSYCFVTKTSSGGF